MREAAFLAVGVLLIILQGNLYPLTRLVGLYGVTPNLVLPLVIFLGVQDASVARGALLAFALGYAVDLFGAAPIGLFTFIYVVIWGLAKVTGVRLTAQARLATAVVTFLFALVEGVFVLTLLTIFGSDAQRPIEMARVILPHAAATGLFAPFIFRLAQRLYQGSSKAPRVPEGST
jgi:rod shape-determining protein MreD